jgi:hypothetical protein
MVSSVKPNGDTATYTIRKVTGATLYNWTVPANATIIQRPGVGANDTIIKVRFGSAFVSGSVTVSSGNACGNSAIKSLAISKTMLTATPGTITALQTATCPDKVYRYSIAALPAGATSVTWTVPNNGVITSGQGTLVITVSYTTNIAITGNVTVRGVNNCSISPARSLAVSYTACPVITTNVPVTKREATPQVEQRMQTQVFPNPSSAMFNVKVTSVKQDRVVATIFDMQGRVVKQLTNVKPGSTQAFGEDLKPGSYLLQIRQGDAVETTKLLKF